MNVVVVAVLLNQAAQFHSQQAPLDANYLGHFLLQFILVLEVSSELRPPQNVDLLENGVKSILPIFFSLH